VTPAQVVEQVRAAGAELSIAGERLHVKPGPHGIPKPLVDALQRCKPDVLALLREAEPIAAVESDPWETRLQAWVVQCAERIIAEICDHCGKHRCEEHGA
jgi:hypothetical protein